MPFEKLFSWDVRGFLFSALLISFFTFGNAGNLFATVTAESEASCILADIVRVRVGDLHFNLPSERQFKLVSRRAELPFLLFFGLGLKNQRITQYLNGKSSVAPAHNYCQEENDSPANVFGFGLVPLRSGLQGLSNDLKEKFSMLWVSKVEVEDEIRRRDLLLSQKVVALAEGQNLNQIDLYKSNVDIGLGRKPSTQYFVKLNHGGQRVFLVECEPPHLSKGEKKPCSFMALFDGNVVISGRFRTNRFQKSEWLEGFRQLDVWLQQLR